MLEVNGKSDKGKIIRAMYLRYFFITYQFEKQKSQIKCCPTDSIWGDFMINPTQGEKFSKFRNYVIGGNE